MGRYATRENEMDHLLRTGTFVDLYSVVRQSIRASVESYSIKRLEPLYAFERAAPLADVGRLMAKLQACLELGDTDGILDDDRSLVQAYNQDDCLSAFLLREWLEGVRSAAMAGGADIPRPVPGDGSVSEALNEWQQRIANLMDRLTHGISLEPTERTDEEQARWLLAYILDWHRREEKTAWWEYFRLGALTDEELIDERAALSGLAFLQQVGGTARTRSSLSLPARDRTARRRRPPQPRQEVPRDDISVESHRDIKKRQDTRDVHHCSSGHRFRSWPKPWSGLASMSPQMARGSVPIMQPAPCCRGRRDVAEMLAASGALESGYGSQLAGYLPIPGSAWAWQPIPAR